MFKSCRTLTKFPLNIMHLHLQSLSTKLQAHKPKDYNQYIPLMDHVSISILRFSYSYRYYYIITLTLSRILYTSVPNQWPKLPKMPLNSSRKLNKLIHSSKFLSQNFSNNSYFLLLEFLELILAFTWPKLNHCSSRHMIKAFQT